MTDQKARLSHALDQLGEDVVTDAAADVAEADRVLALAERRIADRRTKTALPKFRCPLCKVVAISYVLESRPDYDADLYWRRHLCTACDQTYTTTQRVEAIDRPAIVSQHLAS